MFAPSHVSRRRGAFTLIEMLVVIGIIVILVALTAGAVFKALGEGPKVTCRTEIGQFETCIQGFNSKYKVDFIPSALMVGPNMTTGAFTTGAGLASANYLRRVWPNIDLTTTGLPNATLQGDQTLVFFLGGYSTDGSAAGTSFGTVGFSTHPRYPFWSKLPSTTTNLDRVPAFFEFKTDRLQVSPAHSGSPFPSYLDPFGTPYAYFSNYGRTNGYSLIDCAAIAAAPFPGGTAGTFEKPDGYQIISAGPDRGFITGDDFVNFRRLAVGAQSKE